MAWSTPSAQVLGDLITTTIWNQNVKDNVIYIHDRSAPLSCCVATDANAQATGAGSYSVTFDTELLDTDDYHSTSSNTERFIAPVDGLYHLAARFTATGTVNAYIYINGAVTTPEIKSEDITLAWGMIASTVYLSASDYASLYIVTGGETINPSYFSMTLLWSNV